MQDVKLSLEELDRAAKLPGMRAINVTENVLGKNIGDETFWPMWDTCEAARPAVSSSRTSTPSASG